MKTAPKNKTNFGKLIIINSIILELLETKSVSPIMLVYAFDSGDEITMVIAIIKMPTIKNTGEDSMKYPVNAKLTSMLITIITKIYGYMSTVLCAASFTLLAPSSVVSNITELS